MGKNDKIISLKHLLFCCFDLICKTYFHRNFRCTVRLVRRDRSMVVRHSNMLTVHLAMSYDPSGTNGSCIDSRPAGPCTNMNGTKIPIQFRRLNDRPARMSLAILYRCSNVVQHIVQLSHRVHPSVALERHAHFYMPALVSSTDSQNSRFLVHRPIVQIVPAFVDPNRWARISCYCNRIRPNGKQIVSMDEIEQEIIFPINFEKNWVNKAINK